MLRRLPSSLSIIICGSAQSHIVVEDQERTQRMHARRHEASKSKESRNRARREARALAKADALRGRRKEALETATASCISELYTKDLSLAEVNSFFSKPTTQTQRELRKRHPGVNLEKCTFFKIINTPADPTRHRSLAASRRYAEKMAKELVKASEDPRRLASFRDIWKCRRIGQRGRCKRPVKNTHVRKVDGIADAKATTACDIAFFPLQYSDQARTRAIARDPYLGCVDAAASPPEKARSKEASSPPPPPRRRGVTATTANVAAETTTRARSPGAVVVEWALGLPQGGEEEPLRKLWREQQHIHAHDMAQQINKSSQLTRGAHVLSDATDLYSALVNHGERVVALLCVHTDGRIDAIRREEGWGTRFGLRSSSAEEVRTLRGKDFFFEAERLSLSFAP